MKGLGPPVERATSPKLQPPRRVEAADQRAHGGAAVQAQEHVDEAGDAHGRPRAVAAAAAARAQVWSPSGVGGLGGRGNQSKELGVQITKGSNLQVTRGSNPQKCGLKSGYPKKWFPSFQQS